MARRPSHDPAQASFFDLPQPPVNLPGFGLRLREALVETLAVAREVKGLDRFAVASEMSRLDPDREISKAMLDRYCAPSAEDWRFPLEALPALIRVTDDARLLTLVAEACDHRVVPSEAAALGELMMLELKEKRIRERKEALKRSLPQGALQWAEREAARRGR